MVTALHRIALASSAALLAVCRVMLVIMTAVIAALVVSRYFFNYSFPWAEELTRYLLIWMVMLAAALIQRRDDHIRVDFFVTKLPRRLQVAVTLVLRLLIIGLLLLLVRYGWSGAIGMNVTAAPGLGISMTIPYLAIPVGAGLMLLFSLLSLVDDLRRLRGLEPLQPDAPEHAPAIDDAR